MPAGEIRIRGAAELERAFMEVRREVLRELKPAIAAAAEEVRKDAEEKAVAHISNIGPKWSRMRLGVTLRSVYVAPKSKRRLGPPRRNLAPLLMDRAMQPALDEHQAMVVEAIDGVITAAAARNHFLI